MAVPRKHIITHSSEVGCAWPPCRKAGLAASGSSNCTAARHRCHTQDAQQHPQHIAASEKNTLLSLPATPHTVHAMLCTQFLTPRQRWRHTKSTRGMHVAISTSCMPSLRRCAQASTMHSPLQQPIPTKKRLNSAAHGPWPQCMLSLQDRLP